MTHIRCKKCRGSGRLPLAPSLELVYAQLLTRGPGGPWKDLTEVRMKLEAKGMKVSSASLSMKLHKLVEHRLVERLTKREQGRVSVFWRVR